MEPIKIDPSKRYSYADYYSWNDNKRYEIIDGVVFDLSPAPSTAHQKISINLSSELKVFLGRKSKCQVLYAPIDVRIPKSPDDKSDDKIFTVVQPDIIVVCDPKKLDERGCIGAPDLVVEVLSSSTLKRDVKDKFILYEQAGVREYWLIHPADELLTIFRLGKEKKFVLDKIYTYDDKVKVGIFDDLVIDLKDVFEK